MTQRILSRKTAGPVFGSVLGVACLAVAVAAIAGCSDSKSKPAAPAAVPVVAPAAVPAAAAPSAVPVAVGKDNDRPMPMFGLGPSRNMVNLHEHSAPTEWDVESKKNIKWVQKIGSRSYGGPVVSDGKIFVGTNNQNARNPRDQKKDMGVLMCFDLSGKFLWQIVHDKLPSGRVHDWPKEGLCCTPTVEGNRLYYVSNRCEVVCATTDGLGGGKNEGETDEVYKSPTDGDIVWHLNMIKDLNVTPHNMSSSCPLIVGDNLYVVTSNGVDEGHLNLPSPEAPSFICLDKRTGKLKWRDSSPGRNIMHGQWSNPTYLESKGRKQVVFPGGDGWLYSFDPETGEAFWRFDANPKDSKYDLGGKGTRSDFIATPVFCEGKIYIGVGQDPEHNAGVGHLWCIDPDGKGDVSPDLITDNSAFPPKTKPNPNSRAVWHYGGPIPKDEQKKFNGRRHYFGRTLSTCAIHDGLVYACDLGGYFCCLDAKTGALQWDHELGELVWGSPLWVDNKIYIGDDGGIVHIFKHGRKKEIIAENSTDDTPIRSNPNVVDGVLYIMTNQALFAISDKK